MFDYEKLAMGYMSIVSFIILCSCIYGLHHINGLYSNVWPKANSCHFLLFTSKQNCLQKISVLLHDLSVLPPYLVFEIGLSKLNNKKNLKTDVFE